MTIDEIPEGLLLFLDCGCGARRGLRHPTGAATLVLIVKPCEMHAREETPSHIRAVRRGERVIPLAPAQSSI